MLRAVLPELFTMCILLLPCNVSLNVTSLWAPACYWYGNGSQTVAHPSARVYRGERRTLWTQT